MIARSLESALISQALLWILFGLWLQGTSEACTGLMLHNAEGSIVHGRTLEFGMPIQTTIVVVPRGCEFSENATGGPGMKYKAKYGAVGTIAFKDEVIADVRQTIERVEVVDAPAVLDGWRGELLPLHYVVYDKLGVHRN
jgi:penicillin V acylase-like amidase (Ntn superfamily)